MRCPRCGRSVRGIARSDALQKWKWMQKETGATLPRRFGKVSEPCSRCGGRGELRSGNGRGRPTIVRCRDCGAETYEYNGARNALRAWTLGYARTLEERMETRRRAEARIEAMMQPGETPEGVCWCSGYPLPKKKEE